MSDFGSFPWQRILIWALVLGVPLSLLADWGAWDRFPMHALYRVLIVAAGGIGGWLLNYFVGNYVGMGTNVIESMGVFKFSSETPNKIANGFIFVMSVAAAILALFLVK